MARTRWLLSSLAATLWLSGCAAGSAAAPSPTVAPPGQTAAVLAQPTSVPSPLPPTFAPPTPLASITLSGEVPGPDATIPPHVAVIPGLSYEALAAQWEAIGLACSSSIGSFPDSPKLFYTLDCHRDDPAGNVTYNASAIFWTRSGIYQLTLALVSLGNGAIADPSAGRNLFIPSASVAGGEAAGAWVSAHIDDPSCAGASRDCQATIGSLALTLQVGVDGGRQLDIAAASSP